MNTNKYSKKNKHLTTADRNEIAEFHGRDMYYKAIGHLIERNSTTISYEVKHH